MASSTASASALAEFLRTVRCFQDQLRHRMESLLESHCGGLPAEMVPSLKRMTCSGKLVRPTAAFVMARALDSRLADEEIVLPAAALELLHRSTLTPDDFIDAADVRNGLDRTGGKVS